jgi:choline monooxygenase
MVYSQPQMETLALRRHGFSRKGITGIDDRHTFSAGNRPRCRKRVLAAVRALRAGNRVLSSISRTGQGRSMDFVFEPRLELASTLPSSWYVRPEVLELEKQKIFSRTWQLVGRLDQVSRPGDFLTATIADEPVLVVRDAAGGLRALSNVCRHRAGPVASGSGNCRAFRCGYHGWTYSLEGRLLAAPEFDGVDEFEKAAQRLPSFRVDTWRGHIFVNLDPDAAGLADFTTGIEERTGSLDMKACRFVERKDWHLKCNWKTYVDNYLEGYHLPVVHPGLNRELDYSSYRTGTSRFHSVQYSPIRPGTSSRLGVGPEDSSAQALYFWLFPNLMLNVYPDNYSTNLIVPLGPEKTLTVFEWFFREPDAPGVKERIRRAIEFSDEIQREDIAICEAVQVGLRSRNYVSGRYSVRRENGVHHFHGLMAEFMA